MLALRKITIALSIAALSPLAFAQTTGSSPTPNATVGVEPAEGREAMERARQREAEASVVRTDQSAAQRAREAANAARSPGDADRSSGVRSPRADRN